MLKTIETSLNLEGYNSEIAIEEGALNKLSVFLGQENAEAYGELKHEVVTLLDELDSKEELQKDSTLTEDITIATEDKSDMTTYDSVTFTLNITINEFGDISGTVK